MNRKAQTGIISYFFLVIVFVIIWALWLGRYLNESGRQAITDLGLTGIEAFLIANINLFIFIGLVISVLAVSIISFGSGTE